MSVAAIMGIIATLQPFLAGTALGGIAAIATPTKIKGLLFAIKVVTGISSPAKVASKLITAPLKGVKHVATGGHLSESEKIFLKEYKASGRGWHDWP